MILDMQPATAPGLAEVILIRLSDSGDDTDANMGHMSQADYCAERMREKTGYFFKGTFW